MSAYSHHAFEKILSVISQDIVALAGLFCLDTVERNALATELGYGVIVTSVLSVLGILGLVKSSLKLSLGLEQCQKSGFSVDSLRSIYGYLENEKVSSGKKVPCDEIDVRFQEDSVCIRKTRRIYDSVTRPIFNVGNDFAPSLEGKTAINLGNPVYEMSLANHPMLIFLVAVCFSGITPWLLVTLWQKPLELWIFAPISSMHLSLFSMVAVPLWISIRIDRPGQAISRAKLNTVVLGNKSEEHLSFTQYPVNGGHALYFHNNIDAVQHVWFKILVLVVSGLCTVSYIAQFAILKFLDTTRAAIWVGCQAVLAALRLIYCIIKRPYDIPNTDRAEYVVFEDKEFDKMNLVMLSRCLPPGTHTIPLPIWDYLRHNSLTEIVEEARRNSVEKPTIEDEDLFLFDINFNELLKHHRGIWCSWKLPWTFGLAISRHANPSVPAILPKLFVRNPELDLPRARAEGEPCRYWMLFPKVIESSHRYFDFNHNYFVVKRKAVGFVAAEDLSQLPFVPGWAKIASEAFKQFISNSGSTWCNANNVRIFHCATAGITPRDGEGFTPYDPPYCIPQDNRDLKQALNVVLDYVEIGHSRKVMSRYTAVFHPTTALRRFLGTLKSPASKSRRYQARRNESRSNKIVGEKQQTV